MLGIPVDLVLIESSHILMTLGRDIRADWF